MNITRHETEWPCSRVDDLIAAEHAPDDHASPPCATATSDGQVRPTALS